jgi:SAM-dependent methyltransferase
MGELVNVITPLHKRTKRDYVARMTDNKVECMKIAKQYGKDYWDGDRRYGYGGYRYLAGYWEPVAKSLIERYKLTNSSKTRILDVGCGKAYLLYEIKKLLPKAEVVGFDISKYPFKDKEFDLAISITTLHNLEIYDLKKALQEIERVAKNKYIAVESYRNEAELFNLQCWALTCAAFFTPEEWVWLFKEFGCDCDYEFIYFE